MNKSIKKRVYDKPKTFKVAMERLSQRSKIKALLADDLDEQEKHLRSALKFKRIARISNGNIETR